MDELQRYGLLSLACLVVLCLALTFKDRDVARPERDPKMAHARQASLVASGDDVEKSRSGAPVIPEPHADSEDARPDDVPLRATKKDSAAESKKAQDEPAKSQEKQKDGPVAPGKASPTSYVVAKNDTVSRIAREVLGDESRWKEILAANPGLKANSLKVGQSIQLPSKDSVKPATPATPKKPPEVAKVDLGNAPTATKSTAPKPKPTMPKTHTVAKGETLSSIARRHYNDALAWKKIYKANKGRMKSATDVREGLVLALP